MNDLAWMTCKVLGIADHAVIKARTNRNQHITVLHCHVGLVCTVHPQHTQELRARTRKTA